MSDLAYFARKSRNMCLGIFSRIINMCNSNLCNSTFFGLTFLARSLIVILIDFWCVLYVCMCVSISVLTKGHRVRHARHSCWLFGHKQQTYTHTNLRVHFDGAKMSPIALWMSRVVIRHEVLRFVNTVKATVPIWSNRCTIPLPNARHGCSPTIRTSIPSSGPPRTHHSPRASSSFIK